MGKRNKVILIVFLAGSLLAIYLSFYFYQVFFTPNLMIREKAGVLLIPENATIQQVVDSLKKRKYVDDIVSFMFVSKLLEYHGNIKSGRYVLDGEMTNLEAVRFLRSGNQTPVPVIFNNLRLKEELAPKLCKNLIAATEEFNSLINDSAYVAELGFDTTTIVSMFLPNTYEMYWTTDANELIQRMKREYDRFWTQQRKDLAEELGFTPIEVSIIASIVEAETNKEDEKPTIAGVYLNRLERGMLLGADPTVVFALKAFDLKRILNKHLEVDSPYNTYKYAGLPPGPIRIPSLSSIDAVLNYERHKYLYFCAKDDLSGYHAFARTHREHINNANRFHRALNKKGIK